MGFVQVGVAIGFLAKSAWARLIVFHPILKTRIESYWTGRLHTRGNFTIARFYGLKVLMNIPQCHKARDRASLSSLIIKSDNVKPIGFR
jgi:hypothetical protein